MTGSNYLKEVFKEACITNFVHFGGIEVEAGKHIQVHVDGNLMNVVKKLFDQWAKDYDDFLPKLPKYRKLIQIIIKNTNIKKILKYWI